MNLFLSSFVLVFADFTRCQGARVSCRSYLVKLRTRQIDELISLFLCFSFCRFHSGSRRVSCLVKLQARQVGELISLYFCRSCSVSRRVSCCSYLVKLRARQAAGLISLFLCFSFCRFHSGSRRVLCCGYLMKLQARQVELISLFLSDLAQCQDEFRVAATS